MDRLLTGLLFIAYSSCVSCAIAPSMAIELVPKITIRGETGTTQSVEWSPTLRGGGAWQIFTNVTLGSEGAVVVDLAINSSVRFYRLSVPHSPSSRSSFVTVGDAGNAADPATGFGAVDHEFQIQKFEFTNAEYVEFLNAVGGGNPNGIYSSLMGSDPRGGITQSGTSPNFTYAVKGDMGDKPVIFVSWFEAARVANWFHNGRSTDPALLETGAYTLNNATDGIGFMRNAAATYWVPSEDEWYKAAYYIGGGRAEGYWRYPTQSDSDPAYVRVSSKGVGLPGLDSAGNSINANSVADWNGLDGNVTTVGSNGGPSAYGSYDMAGNVWEWDEGVALGSYRIFRGGGWHDGADSVRPTLRSYSNPRSRVNFLGFRLGRSSAP